MNIPPHLAKLPTWRGMPVPYINCWGDEVDEHRWTLRYDPLVDAEAWWTGGTEGEGDAFLAKQNLQRQRACTYMGRCQVCFRIVSSTRRWLALSGSSTAQEVSIDGIGAGQLVVTEPWLCPKCLLFSLEVCPGLIRRRRDDDLMVLRVRRWDLVRTMAWHDDFGPDVQAVTWLKIRPTAADILTIDEARAACAPKAPSGASVTASS